MGREAENGERGNAKRYRRLLIYNDVVADHSK